MSNKTLMSLFVLALLFFVDIQTENLQKQAVSNSDLIEIAIIGSNDLHGTAFPKKLKRTDNG